MNSIRYNVHIASTIGATDFQNFHETGGVAAGSVGNDSIFGWYLGNDTQVTE